MFEKAAIFSGFLVLLAFLAVGIFYYQSLDLEDRVIPILDRK